MTKHNVEELRLIAQLLLGIFIAMIFAYFLSLNYEVFPWFSFAGTSTGIAIIVLCWTGSKYWFFIFSLLMSTLISSLTYNWQSIF